MKDNWTKFCCGLIGWNYQLLKECSEASRKTLHRYAGAVMLMMLVWGFIGYCMANRYFELDTLGSAIVSACFAIVILLIERQIILVVGNSKSAYWFRLGLAGCMSLIGATIIDQHLFGKDIDAAMHSEIEQRTDEQLSYRQKIIDTQIASYHYELDSLLIVSSNLSEEIAKRPVVVTTTYNKQASGRVDSLGRPLMTVGYAQNTVQNPKSKDLDRVNSRIDILREQLSEKENSLQSLRDSLYVENERNIGLLTELKITFSRKVIFSSLPSGIFYLIVLIFFLMIEMLIVSSKLFSHTKCDYEVLIERGQERRIEDICAVISRHE